MTARAAGVLLALLAAAQPAASAGVAWFDGPLDRALELAARDGRLVLLDGWASWCGFCHRMDDEVWSDDDLARALAAEVVAVRAEIDVPAGVGRDLAERYRIGPLPAVLVIDPLSGEALEHLTGYQRADAILAAVDRARTRWGERHPAATQPSAGAADLRQGLRLLRRGDLEGAEQAFERTAQADPDCAAGLLDDAAIGLADALMPAGRERADRALAAALARCGEGARRDALWSRRIELARATGGADAVGALLRERLRAEPDDPAALLGYLDWAVEHARAPDELEAAAARADRAAALMPDDPAPLAARARILARLGRHDEALDALERAIELDPHDPALRELRLKWVLRARRRSDAGGSD